MLPDGATYHSDFINEVEEQVLLSEIDNNPWCADLKRRVQHYGYRYDYAAGGISAVDFLGRLPVWLDCIIARLVDCGYFCHLPDQAIINEYLPGQGITSHVDCGTCFGERIASLSLGSGCEMKFSAQRTDVTLAKYLAPRSLLHMAGPARWNWTHAIPARKSDIVSGQRMFRDRRVSVTFRNVTP